MTAEEVLPPISLDEINIEIPGDGSETEFLVGSPQQSASVVALARSMSMGARSLGK